jgi:hypothetical protein
MNSTFVQNEYFGKIRRELRPEQKTKIKRRYRLTEERRYRLKEERRYSFIRTKKKNEDIDS